VNAIPRSNERNDERGLLPFKTIIKAINGDSLAMDQVLDHYDNHINYLSTCHIRSEQGHLIPIINMEVKDRLTSKLVQAVMRFRVERFGLTSQFKSTKNKPDQE